MHSILPERTAGAAGAARSAGKPVVARGRTTGTGLWWNCCVGSLWGMWKLARAQGRHCSWLAAWRTKGRWSAAPTCICVEGKNEGLIRDAKPHRQRDACQDEPYSHALRDSHVALGRLWGDTAGGDQCLHWLVQKHAAGNKICNWKNSISPFLASYFAEYTLCHL